MLNVSTLPPELEQEPLDGTSSHCVWDSASDLTVLTTRILHRIRFVAEQRQLDAISTIYILPFIFNVLEGADKKSQGSTPEAFDEQVLLSIQFLSYHTETCKMFNWSLQPTRTNKHSF